MTTLIKDIVLNKMIDIGLDCRLRYSNLDIWNSIYDNLDYQPISYSQEMIDYQNAYINSCDGNLEDISVVVYSGGLPVGLWLLHCSLEGS